MRSVPAAPEPCGPSRRGGGVRDPRPATTGARSESEIRILLLALYHAGAAPRNFGVNAAGVDDLVLAFIASAVDGLGEPEAPALYCEAEQPPPASGE